jgi:1-acyl-sn-glycerol-3-phosphate acyltransferase
LAARRSGLGAVKGQAPIGAEMPHFYRSVRTIIGVLFKVLTRRECAGLENLDLEPPYIVALNHISVFDTPAMLTLFRHRVVAFAAEKHRANPVYGPLLEAMGTIFVRRGEVDRQALRDALAWLAQGGVLGVAPEGTRARGTYALQEAKTGIAYLATRASVPILPVGIAGTERLKDNMLRLRRTDLRIAVGEPIRLPKAGRAGGEELRVYTDLVMARIAGLLPEEYRGVYA